MDALSWARFGARVTGVDFSPVAIARAQALAERAGLAAEFIEADAQLRSRPALWRRRAPSCRHERLLRRSERRDGTARDGPVPLLTRRNRDSCRLGRVARRATRRAHRDRVPRPPHLVPRPRRHVPGPLQRHSSTDHVLPARHRPAHGRRLMIPLHLKSGGLPPLRAREGRGRNGTR
ncbi:class I SAM-dependent methyltransferase [Streptomyces sp. NBC_01483]|uniref:class I SAM-dependent methyltransferase n=1 Tax=Streptomyces sp. NBC_01483 TaxID=2903883 RepID=UPI002E31B183|nr:class I SAM-dependent methyltransferase [Streptomyces sp. NBC_01483]